MLAILSHAVVLLTGNTYARTSELSNLPKSRLLANLHFLIFRKHFCPVINDSFRKSSETIRRTETVDLAGDGRCGSPAKYRTSMGLLWDLYGTFVGPLWDLCGTFMGPSWDLRGTFVGPLWDLCGTFVGPSWDLRGTFVGPSWDLCGTFVGPLRCLTTRCLILHGALDCYGKREGIIRTFIKIEKENNHKNKITTQS